MKKILINIISQQRMPIFLGILALQPDLIINLLSSNRFSEEDKNIKSAVELFSEKEDVKYRPEFKTLSMEIESPDIDETFNFLSEKINKMLQDTGKDLEVVFNITGGTKLMALGAYEFLNFQNFKYIYCDTQLRKFHTNLEYISDFKEVWKKIDTSLLLGMHGIYPQKDYKTSQYTEADLKFGRDMLSNLIGDIPDREDIQAIHKFCDNQGNKEQLINQLKTPFPILKSTGGKKLTEIAAKYGYLKKEMNGYFLNYQETEVPRKKLEKFLRKIKNLLTGTWLELAVIDILIEKAYYRDIKWSVDVQQGGETDIICINDQEFLPYFISCKVDFENSPILEHLESLNERTKKYAGTFGKALLVTLEQKENRLQQLKKFADILKVSLWDKDVIIQKIL